MPVYVGEAAIDTVMAHGKAFVLDAQQVQHGGVDIVDLGGMLAVQGFVAPLVTFPGGNTAPDAAAAEPVGEDVRIVVAALAAL